MKNETKEQRIDRKIAELEALFKESRAEQRLKAQEAEDRAMNELIRKRFIEDENKEAAVQWTDWDFGR